MSVSRASLALLVLLFLLPGAAYPQAHLLQRLLALPVLDPPQWVLSEDERFLLEWTEPGRRPDAATRKRLWELARKRPGLLAELADYLPDRPEVHAALLEVYRGMSQDAREELGGWLRRNTAFLREDLVRSASLAGTDAWDEVVEEDLKALARLDPLVARPLLERLVRGGRPYESTLARTLLWRSNPSDEALRKALLRIAEDRKARASARNLAILALLEVEWPARDRLFLRLMEDPALGWLSDDQFFYQPLVEFVRQEPDRWIPRVVPLIGNPNRAVHDNAVEILISFHLEDARADALRPLLPWLQDEGWSSARDRLRLIQSLEEVRLPEAVPGLISVVRHDPDSANRSYAAESLAAYGDRSAVPALREALARETEGEDRRRYLGALLALGALTVPEQVRGLETFARAGGTRELMMDLEHDFSGKPRPLDLVTGAWLAGLPEPPPGLLPEVLDRMDGSPPSRTWSWAGAAPGWTSGSCSARWRAPDRSRWWWRRWNAAPGSERSARPGCERPRRHRGWGPAWPPRCSRTRPWPRRSCGPGTRRPAPRCWRGRG